MKTSFLTRGLLLLAMLFTTALSHAQSANQNAAEDLLRQMNSAPAQHNYYGSILTTCNNVEQIFKIVNITDGEKNVYQSIESMGSSHGKIVRQDKILYCYFPADKVMVKDNVNHDGLLSSMQSYPVVGDNLKSGLPIPAIKQFYDTQVTDGMHEISGRESYIIDLLPKDDYRFMQQITIDKESSVLLQLDVFDDNHQLLRSQMFTEIVFEKPEGMEELPADTSDDIANQGWQIIDHTVDMPEDMEKPGAADNMKDLSQPLSLVKGQCHLPKVLHGYQLQNMMARKQSEDMTEQFNYSDGLSTISIFVDFPMGEKSASDDSSAKGMFAQKDTIVSYMANKHGAKLVIMGEVPKPLIMAFAENLQCQDKI